MTRPHGITGSLTPTFVPAPAVALAVSRPSAFALIVRLPSALRAPLRASVTISEATAPVKLPASHGPRRCKRPREIVNKTRVVFHWWLPLDRNPGIDASHLCYASHADDQWQAIVKCTGSFCPDAGNRNPHRYCSFAELTEETAVKSLRHSCRSELTRQGISLP